MKKWIRWFIILLPWFLFLIQRNFLTIEMPIKIPNIIFYIFTIINIFFTSYSVTKLHEKYSFSETKEYNRYLLVYYFFFQGTFLSLSVNIFLSLSCAIITFLSSLFLYYESKSYDKIVSKYLWYPLYYNLFISILLFITYFMNL